jgi:hypothetical protein
MTLREIVKKHNTDKNTDHCYIDYVYEDLFLKLKDSATAILEIGIYYGGSILLWQEYFSTASVHGVDISNIDLSSHSLNDRIKTFCDDAYSEKFIYSIEDKFYDVIIDDGPHTLESMRVFVSKYLSKVKDNGYLILEDIQDISWVEDIKNHIDKSIPSDTTLYDLRSIKGRWDDIVLVIQRSS